MTIAEIKELQEALRADDYHISDEDLVYAINALREIMLLAEAEFGPDCYTVPLLPPA